MADAGNQEFPTTLGPDAVFKGELTFDKGLRLHGRLEGKINTAGRLHVAKEAKMSADVDAGAIIVEGDVKGNLTASDRIEMKQNARYEGDLGATKLVVDEGAVQRQRHGWPRSDQAAWSGRRPSRWRRCPQRAGPTVGRAAAQPVK